MYLRQVLPVLFVVILLTVAIGLGLRKPPELRRPPPTDAATGEAGERDRRIAELEARLSKPAGIGVLPPVAAIALAGSLVVLWMQAPDVSYYFSSRDPIDLGSEGSYRFELAQSNRYVQIHGAPTVRGAYWADGGGTWVAVGLRDTPVLVKRGTFPNEDWKPGMPRGPQPDQRPMTVRGRLLSRADAPKYEPVFAQHEQWGEVSPKWLLVAELRPGGDLGAMGWFTLMLAFAGLNAWMLMRGVIVYLHRRAR